MRLNVSTLKANQDLPKIEPSTISETQVSPIDP